ncbi:MAG: phosphoribosylamine--glycine ligase [Thermoleophilia bacterium]|nr:phosphoribosylamine--glycine ligase [Thermoleophilia bacterium]
MRVLVVGGGGREHALVHSFSRSSLRPQVFCAPGNAGIAAEADCVPVGAEDLEGLLDFATRERPDLTVVGPEAPLVDGLADRFRERGLLVFGPDAHAAQMEGSKVFAKEVMDEGGAPTGAYSRHTSAESAFAALAAQSAYPVVVKADGLAAGKGVIIAADEAEARDAVESMLVARSFGAAGDVVLIEEHLTGSEVSLLVLCDGETAVPLAPAQDYKRIFAGDRGPNTGGMGSYCPVPGFGPQAVDAAMDTVVQPVLDALRRRGITYRGVLYAGLIVTADGLKVLEFNCRFGDPETQAVLPRLESDLLELCLAAASGELAGAAPSWVAEDCVTVVMASAGYPASSHKGDVIEGLEAAAALPGVTVYHAGTAVAGDSGGTRPPAVATAGGRVLAVSALGGGFAAARERAYEGIRAIRFDGAQTRPDIAERAVRAQTGEISLFPEGWRP